MKNNFKKEKKLESVILYLLNKLGRISIKKLTYLLYFLEMDYYEKYNKKFLGLTFYKKNKGIKIYLE